jgi:hypothetical protein
MPPEPKLPPFPQARWVAPVMAVFLAFACLAAPLKGFVAPRLNWDMLAYVGITLSWQGLPPDEILARSFADAHAYAAAHGLMKFYNELIDPSDAYRHAVSTDPQAFLNQFPFYRIRPFYLALVRLLSSFGGSVVAVCVAISAASVLLLTSSVAIFCVRSLGWWKGALLAAIYVLSPSVFEIASFQTPDALSAAVVGCGIALLLRGWSALGAVTLLFGVTVRSDQMIMNGLLGVAMLGLWLLRDPARSGRRRGDLLAAGILLASAPVERLMSHMVGGFGYAVLFDNTFISGFTATPQNLGDFTLSIGKLVSIYLNGLLAAFRNGVAWEVFGLMAAQVVVLGMLNWPRRGVALVAAIAMTAGVRFAIFPSADLRLFAPVIVAQALALFWLIGGGAALSGTSPSAHPPSSGR